MSKTWTIIEKVIGVLIGVWGVFALYGITDTLAQMIHTGYAEVNHLTTGTLILKHHLNFLLAVGSLFSGFLLMFGYREGWLFSIVCCVLYVMSLYQSSMLNAMDTSKPYNAFFKSYSMVALLFLIFAILLLQKPFWKKYRPTSRELFRTLLVFAVLVLDKLLL